MENINFKYYNITKDQSPEDFFKWCLDKKLYKSSGGVNFLSRMEAVYSGVEEFVGISAVVAFKKTRPVGIALCEHRQLDFLTNIYRKSKNYFYNLGFLNVYVKLNSRKKGLGTNLVNQIELFRLNILENIQELKKEEEKYPFFVCREKAKLIVSNNCKYTYAIGSDDPHRGRDLEINHLDYGIRKPSLEMKIKEKFHYNNIKEYFEIENNKINENDIKKFVPRKRKI